MGKKLAKLQKQIAQLQKQVSRQELLNKIVHAMRSTLALDEILQITVNQLSEALDVSRCLILRPEEGNQMIVHYVSVDTTGSGDGNLIGVPCHFCGYHYQTLARGKFAFLSRIEEGLPAQLRVQFSNLRINAILSVPLIYQKSYLGAISLHQYGRSREWTEDDFSFVQEVASHCAVAMHQALLHQNLQIKLAECQRVESRIQASLQQKEVLLSEVHHRVKNNMQVISSLLDLQSLQTQNQDTRQMFAESRNRIKSMALIHEQLYRFSTPVGINFAQYIYNLSSYLLKTYAVNPNNIRLQLDLDDVVLNLSTAIPCGLMLNELISNALKHAFPGNSKGTIFVELKMEGNQINLMVSNNGVKLPETKEFLQNTSLGFQLIQAWVQQLQGQLSIESNPITKFKLSFSELEYSA
ncbi:MAG: GAF domain-containing protein [Symploca sp. SIO2E9]|nr:GAF domain-containing protein [Symploca sp. SIO2E9]